MKKIIINLENLDVCTINASKFRNGGATLKARTYTYQIYHQLLAYKDQMDKFRSTFNALPKRKKKLHLKVKILVPFHKYFTKDGDINIHSIDLDNYLKLLIDSVMDNRHHGEYHKGAKINVEKLDVNDKYIVKLMASKDANPNPSEEKWTIQFHLKIV